MVGGFAPPPMLPGVTGAKFEAGLVPAGTGALPPVHCPSRWILAKQFPWTVVDQSDGPLGGDGGAEVEVSGAIARGYGSGASLDKR